MGVTSNQEQLVNFSPQPVSSSGSTPGTPNLPVSITAANFLAAYQASPQILIEGYYLITDQCEVGMLIQTAKDKNGIITPSLEALGFYDNSDFQDVGNYVNLTIPKGTNWGVWYQGLELTTITYDTLAGGTFSPGDIITEPTNSAVGICISDDGIGTMTLVSQTPNNIFVAGNSINNGLGVSANELTVTYPTNAVTLGDIVFWNGFHYQLIDDTAIDGTNPSTNATAYLLKPKGTTANVGYIRVENKVEYDFRNNKIILRKDERNNHIETPIIGNSNFQFGNDNVICNYVVSNSTLICINNRGEIKYNNVSSGSSFELTRNSGIVYNNIITSSATITAEDNSGEIRENTATTRSDVSATNNEGIINSCSFINTCDVFMNTNKGIISSNVVNNSPVTINLDLTFSVGGCQFTNITYTAATTETLLNLSLIDYPSYDNAVDAAAAEPSNILWQTTGNDITFLGGIANIVLRVP